MRFSVFKKKISATKDPERAAASPIFLDSLPKSGTHLLAKALTGLPGIEHSGRHMDRKTIAEFADQGVVFPLEGREDINIQSDFPWIERLLESIPAGRFLTAHLNFHPKVHETLLRMNFKILLMMRDPRDVVMSWADYIARERNHLLHPFFVNTDLNYRITCGIQGVSGEITGTRRQPSIAELISGHLKWKTEGRAFLVRFEELIGDKGGGSREIQRRMIRKLAAFLETECDEPVVDGICTSLFGGTYTFNSGLIGRWRKGFSEAHKALFKETAGRMLIDLGYEASMNW